MPQRETEAIVLRSFSLGEADRIVSFLGRTTGRLRGVARGARRPKSRFGSTLEPLSHIRIWFYERETRELVRITQSELLHSFLEAQREYAAGLSMAVISEITETVLPEREPNDASFRLLLAVVQAVAARPTSPLPLAYFSLWTLRLAGWLPALDRCARCGRALADSALFDSPSSQGVWCADCRPPYARETSAPQAALLRRMLAERITSLEDVRLPDAEIRRLTGMLLDRIEHQAERKLNSRQLLEAQWESPN